MKQLIRFRGTWLTQSNVPVYISRIGGRRSSVFLIFQFDKQSIEFFAVDVDSHYMPTGSMKLDGPLFFCFIRIDKLEAERVKVFYHSRQETGCLKKKRT